TLLEAGPEIESVALENTADTLMLDVRGTGKLSVAAKGQVKVVLNGHNAPVGKVGSGESSRYEVELPRPEALELDSPTFSTDPQAITRPTLDFAHIRRPCLRGI